MGGELMDFFSDLFDQACRCSPLFQYYICSYCAAHYNEVSCEQYPKGRKGL